MGCILYPGPDWNEPVLPADVGGGGEGAFEFQSPRRQKTNETRPPSLNQREPPPPNPRPSGGAPACSSRPVKRKSREEEEEKESRLSDRSKDWTTKGHVDRQD